MLYYDFFKFLFIKYKLINIFFILFLNILTSMGISCAKMNEKNEEIT